MIWCYAGGALGHARVGVTPSVPPSANVYIFWHIMETNQSVAICKKFGDSLEHIVGRFECCGKGWRLCGSIAKAEPSLGIFAIRGAYWTTLESLGIFPIQSAHRTASLLGFMPQEEKNAIVNHCICSSYAHALYTDTCTIYSSIHASTVARTPIETVAPGD